jgi:Flp pilus assembly protein TadD
VVDFTKVIAMQPLNAAVFFRRAFALKSIRRFEDAAADFERAKKLDPTNPHFLVNYKKIYDVEYIELCRSGEEPPYEPRKQQSD